MTTGNPQRGEAAENQQLATPASEATRPTNSARKTLGYVRVSTDRQELGRQRWLVEQWARLTGVAVDAWLEDDGLSGRASAVKGAAAARGADLAYYAALCTGDYLATVERPGFLNLLQAVEDGRFGRVVVAAVDRLSRDVVELLLVERLLRLRGCELVVVDQGSGATTTDDAAGFLQFALKAVLAEWECRQTGDRTRQALAAKREAGKVLGRPPAGWVVDPDSGQRVPDPEKWPVLLALVDLRERDLTFEEIAAAGLPGVANKVTASKWWKSWERRHDDGFHATPEQCQWQGMASTLKAKTPVFLNNGSTEEPEK